MCCCYTLFSSMTHQILDNLRTQTTLISGTSQRNLALSPLSLPSICPSFSLSLRGVSTKQKVPDGKQKMVWCCCHRPAVYTPGLDSSDIQGWWEFRCRGEKDIEKQRKLKKIKWKWEGEKKYVEARNRGKWLCFFRKWWNTYWKENGKLVDKLLLYACVAAMWYWIQLFFFISVFLLLYAGTVKVFVRVKISDFRSKYFRQKSSR